MHQILAAFFAFFLSFGHATHTARLTTQADAVAYRSIDYVPSRREIEQGTYLSSYAEKQCTSCRTMNASFTAR